jgi:hypothetical protein
MDYGERVRLGYCDPEPPEPRLPRLPRRGGPWRTPRLPTIRAISAQKAWARLAAYEDRHWHWLGLRPLIPTIDDDDIPF